MRSSSVTMSCGDTSHPEAVRSTSAAVITAGSPCRTIGASLPNRFQEVGLIAAAVQRIEEPGQANLLVRAMLANVGGRELYPRVVRDRDARAFNLGDPIRFAIGTARDLALRSGQRTKSIGKQAWRVIALSRSSSSAAARPGG